MTNILTPNQDELELLSATSETLNLRLLRAQVRRAEDAANLTHRRLVRDEAEHAPVLEFFTDTNEESVAPCIVTLGNWSRTQPGVPIEIILNSPGGTVSGGNSFYEFLMELRSRGHKITIMVMGQAASMAGVILQAADVRLIGARSWFMLHEVQGAELGKVSEMKDGLETSTRMQTKLVEILSGRSMEKPGGLTTDDIQEMWNKTDVWLDAYQALAYHFVDAIINEPANQAIVSPKAKSRPTERKTGSTAAKRAIKR